MLVLMLLLLLALVCCPWFCFRWCTVPQPAFYFPFPHSPVCDACTAVATAPNCSSCCCCLSGSPLSMAPSEAGAVPPVAAGVSLWCSFCS